MGDCVCSKDAAVLLVGPGLAMLPGLERELRTRGFEIEIANSGEAGLSRAAARNFAVIASELEMPGVSGLDLLARLRLLKPPPPPLILVTSHATADSAIEASKLGVYELVSKPIDILGFADLISKAAVSKAPLTIPLTRNGADPVTLVGSNRLKIRHASFSRWLAHLKLTRFSPSLGAARPLGCDLAHPERQLTKSNLK